MAGFQESVDNSEPKVIFKVSINDAVLALSRVRCITSFELHHDVCPYAHLRYNEFPYVIIMRCRVAGRRGGEEGRVG